MDQIELQRGDVRDSGAVSRAVGGADLVFHLAGQSLVRTGKRSPAATFDVNVRGTWTVLEACLAEDVQRIVVASSQEAYGPTKRLPFSENQPLLATSPYGASKAAAEVIAGSYWRTYGLPVCITRCANTYGGGDMNFSRLVPEVLRAVLGGERAQIRSDGTAERDFLYVEDAVGAFLALADQGRGVDGEAFNIGGTERVTVLEMVRLVCEAAGAPFDPQIDHTVTSDNRYLDCSKLRDVCGVEATTSLRDGLQRTVSWGVSSHLSAGDG